MLRQIGRAVVLCCVATSVWAQPQQETYSGKVRVKLSPDSVAAVETRLKSGDIAATDIFSRLSSLDRLGKAHRTDHIRRLFPDAGKYEAKHRRYGLHLWYEISVPDSADLQTVAEAYQRDANVLIAEPAHRIRRLSISEDGLWLPDDPQFNRQWHFHNTGQTGGTVGVDIRLPEAWAAIDAMGIRNRNVVVAVIDGGINCLHEDLLPNLWVNQAEQNGTEGKDDDGNGYEDDIHGFNFVLSTGSRKPIGVIQPEDHATHVAATIAAATNNGMGVAGMGKDGYGIRVMSVQIMTETGSVASIVEAFTYAADNGAVIAQNSWGYDDPNVYSRSDTEAINYFIAEAGRDENGNLRSGTPMAGGVVIFAAGNGHKNVNTGTDEHWYPAYYDNVIAVGSVNHYGKRAYYSNYGSWVDIAAPGGDTKEKETGGVYSASYRANNLRYYEYMQGTSMACPQVSGVAALILAVYGNGQFTPEMLHARLLKSATPLSIFGSGNIPELGNGLVNAAQAIAPGGTPEAIRDLTATASSHTSGSLTWTTPFASGNGKTAYFTVACASTPISADNFTQYAGTPVASSAIAGAQQSHSMTNLQPATTHYVAVQSIGNFGERSEISNIAVFTTPVKPPDQPDKLLVYPNPVQETLYYVFVLDIPSGETASVNIRVMDTAGRILHRISHVGLHSGAHYFEMNTSNWKSGMYILQYERNKKTNVQKIIKY